MNSFNWGLTHFRTSEQSIHSVLAEAMNRGGEYADLFFEHTTINSISLRDGAVNEAASNVEYGAGVRVVTGERTGYAYTEIASQAELLRAAQAASFIVTQPESASQLPVAVTPLVHASTYYPSALGWEDVSLRQKSPFLSALNEKIFAADSNVTKVIVSFADSVQHILFANTLGQAYYDYRPLATLSVTCVMQQCNRVERANASRSFRAGAEMLTETLVDELAGEVVSQCRFLFGATQPKGGEMSVVMGAGDSGILLHEAIGHAFEADFVRKATSIFSEKLGQKICDSAVRVVDDACLAGNRGSLNWDDEGVEGQRTYLVTDGVLTSFLHDRISATALGSPLTGNGRRESFRYYPVPRMRSTYMEDGPATEEELIAEVKRGVFVDNFSNGQVQIGAGDFTFFVKSGYMIENGKLTQPIKDINIIGNGPKALSDIIGVANNGKIDNGAWTCGKEGQSCPVTCGMPSVLVSKLIVG